MKNGPSASNKKTPEHTIVTRYSYNTLNQVVAQQTPDAGISNFWYDALGRLVVSQNAKQANPLAFGEGSGERFSYTIYDDLGRITEVGQKPKPNGGMNQNLTRNPERLSSWLTNNQKREQITRTVYDVSYYSAADPGILKPNLYQRNLRNRVSYTQVFDIEPAVAGVNKWKSTHNAATYYTYDIHGNVDTLLQDYNSGIMATAKNRYKRIAYQYDLISGKVNMVEYQPPVYWEGQRVHQPDYFVHRYQYDAENRLTDVETSRDKMVWEKVGRYDYYKHGSLATTITGQQQIQSVTNAYTLQGWIKGTVPNANASNTLIAQSAFSYSLGYYTGDYKAINGADIFASTSLPSNAEAKDLYNGNISSMFVSIAKIGEPVLHTYKYDQLNRIKQVNNFKSYNALGNTWQPTPEHKEALTFDANGNIQTALLNGNTAALDYKNFNYNYDPVKKNRLLSITNTVNNTTSNYEYDEIGNITKDELEGNAEMQWNVYGKLTRVKKESGVEIIFKYDAAGNRIAKITGEKEQWSVRDAAGNLMANYQRNAQINNGKLSTEAFYMYGSGMLGSWKQVINVENNKESAEAIKYFKRGEQEFYFANHLGNNLLILSDKKTGIDDNGDGISDRYVSDVISATDYSAYGENLPGREFKSSLIQFGFNNKWNDSETGYQDYGMRMYSSKRRGFLSVDPLAAFYPYYSPYQFTGNSPIANIDLDGAEPKPSITGNESEGDNKTTSATSYATLHNIPKTVSAVWYWHAGGLKTGQYQKQEDGSLKEILTKPGWYTSKGYVNVLKATLAAGALAENLSLLSGPAKLGSSSEELSNFVGSGLSENAGNHLIIAALEKASAANFAVSGTTYPSAFNVEDILGIGLLAKEGLKILGGVAARNISSFEGKQLLINAPELIHRHHILPQQFKSGFKNKESKILMHIRLKLVLRLI